jgi:hypothetical protein
MIPCAWSEDDCLNQNIANVYDEWTEIDDSEEPPRLPRDTVLSANVGTKIRRAAAVARSE